MAGETFNTNSVIWSDPKQLADKAAEDETVSWSDWAKEAAAATVDIGAGAATLADTYAGNATTRRVRQSLNETSAGLREGQSAAAKRARDATFNPWSDDPTVYGEGIGRSIGMKTMSALPSLVLSVLPAGLVA
jgi:hypothetical protein